MGHLDNRHPSTIEKRRWFAHEHLPESLALVSAPFADLADHLIAMIPDHPQLTLALQHLLEAKDAAVRARLAGLTPEGALAPDTPRPMPTDRHGVDTTAAQPPDEGI